MNIETVLKHIVEAFNTGNLSRVDEIFALNYVDHQRPDWLKAEGSEEFRQIVLGARKSLPNLVVSINDSIVHGDKIIAHLHWLSVDDAGKRIERETEDILLIKDGKVTEHWGTEIAKHVAT